LVIAEGTPEDVANTAGSYTGHFLRPLLGLEGDAPKTAQPVAAKKKAAKTADPKPKVARKK
jgi:excinuclease ABC subunit A